MRNGLGIETLIQPRHRAPGKCKKLELTPGGAPQNRTLDHAPLARLYRSCHQGNLTYECARADGTRDDAKVGVSGTF